MSDAPRDQQSPLDPSGPAGGPAGAGDPTDGGAADASARAATGSGRDAGDSDDLHVGDPTDGGAAVGAGGTREDATTTAGAAGATSGRRGRAARFAFGGPETDPRKRRRRRWFVGAIVAGAALVVVALCAGGLAVLGAVSGFRDDADDAREERQLRDASCLELEQRLNRLTPPGATASPQARATAVRDENAALRLYLPQVRDGKAVDGWRQLLDARTSYAEALDTQAASKTPAFFVAPKSADGKAVTGELVRLSPGPCAGPIRRLQAPDL
ncbi:hypothetical protein [Symbioplanes lichenis]|uniref:hypothetical protein n=1 Tax=Symbioplanes lichenis TaxID=1629072 RepID=UPI0027386161|nr:hypothetical protein [Actinoplanes lichenis]